MNPSCVQKWHLSTAHSNVRVHFAVQKWHTFLHKVVETNGEQEQRYTGLTGAAVTEGMTRFVRCREQHRTKRQQQVQSRRQSETERDVRKWPFAVTTGMTPGPQSHYWVCACAWGKKEGKESMDESMEGREDFWLCPWFGEKASTLGDRTGIWDKDYDWIVSVLASQDARHLVAAREQEQGAVLCCSPDAVPSSPVALFHSLLEFLSKFHPRLPFCKISEHLRPFVVFRCTLE